MKTRLKLGDFVKVLVGKDRGKTGKIIGIDRKKGKVLVESINVVKKVVKARTPQEKGKIVNKEANIDISNVMLFFKGFTSRIGIRFEDNKKVRYLKKSGEKI